DFPSWNLPYINGDWHQQFWEF
ncbi:unnamed protein product, partial [Allacma fusca]